MCGLNSVVTSLRYAFPACFNKSPTIHILCRIVIAVLRSAEKTKFDLSLDDSNWFVSQVEKFLSFYLQSNLELASYYSMITVFNHDIHFNVSNNVLFRIA